MVNIVDISVLIPVSYEGKSLRTTFPEVLNSLSTVSRNTEIILIGDRSHKETNREACRLANIDKVRFIEVDSSGKFDKLSAGVSIAKGNILIAIDADILPAPFTFVKLLKPILENEADVSAGHPLAVINTHDAESPIGKLLSCWAQMSMEIWNIVRKENLYSRWALPGNLFALRKEYFPIEALVPVLDDASIGLFAMERGARFAYQEDAVVGALTPNSYSDWISQKLRIRRGWSILYKIKQDECKILREAISIAKKQVFWQSPMLNTLLYTHDKLLRIYASIFLCSHQNPLKSSWQPVLSTKNWDKKKHRIFIERLDV